MNKMEFLGPEYQRQLLRKPFEKKRGHSYTKRATSENSIEDSLKTICLQGNETNSKPHVKILREVLSWYGIIPNYELLRVEGKCHEPIFKYRVWFNDKEAIGDGRTKKEAIYSAAKAIIDKLTGVCKTDDSTRDSTTINSNINDFNSSLMNNAFGNPIGWLQELCTARHWPPPKYENDMVLGQLHPLTFRISCVVAKYREIGQGKSKKIAKLLAAHKVWMIIQKEIYTKSKANQDLEDDGFFDISPISIDDINCIQYLQEVAAANQIEVKYKHIEKSAIASCFQCLVQLSTHPVASCHGMGTSKTEAHTNAAHNAVEYLKVLSTSLLDM